jgi:hypothetical protein
MTQDSKPFTIYGLPVRGRSCGSCKLCCTLLPVDLPRGKKPANVKCEHSCSKGCNIYDHRPDPCKYWSCRWLFDDDTANLRRPDKSGYVIDCALDTVIVNGQPCDAIQVWVDPARRDAHRDPALREYLNVLAERHRILVIVRWSSSEGMGMIAPVLSGESVWLEADSILGSQESIDKAKAESKIKYNPMFTET